ncbi:MAG: HAD-IA family hydrolase [Verrucomicrobiota bacterium]
MKAALIDIGNVILNVDFVSTLTRLVPENLADPLKRVESLLEKKDDLESGGMEPGAFVKWASEKLQFEGEPGEFLEAWNDIFEPNIPMWETLRGLKSRGLKLVLFSNTNAMHVDYFLPKYGEVFEMFEGRVFSHEVGAIKPDPAIYHHAFEKYDLNPAETIYVDDLPENISTGLQLGLAAWRYRAESHGALTRWLVETLD